MTEYRLVADKIGACNTWILQEKDPTGWVSLTRGLMSIEEAKKKIKHINSTPITLTQ